ncbi:hypothetical protein CC1G_09958 [Coprinopsis cinerea okayama7|uniref:18S rRNA factor 2 n=1 Tax=Coprinopsis cinerea (strain Okayama-7 / 130 / ATCC MYA-4618 / FGSC 9003) TaxID=240176 RepID=A8PGS1_COPC7|nr:hypothetical protein CC1G_09958 [Coprinopsis cinerea okayama7\|eukprot:XP_001841266.1 hypothetical protein CC1G_09958 [Coprinopsis cinerea okayama7\
MRSTSPEEKSEQPEAGSSKQPVEEAGTQSREELSGEEDGNEGMDEDSGLGFGMDPEGFAGEKVVKPLTPEALAAFKAAQERAGVIYISRIPPGMRPAKVRHLMSAYGEVGRVYLQQEDPKRAYLRRKFTSTKKPHFTEGWVEFKDKKVARSVAEMLNAQPIGGKKGSRWRDDIWTMKYLPKFKWNMLTEQVAHEAAVHTAKLRVELSQSRAEQQEYLRNVETARVLEKRAEKKREKGEEFELKPVNVKKRPRGEAAGGEQKKKKAKSDVPLDSVLSSVF